MDKNTKTQNVYVSEEEKRWDGMKFKMLSKKLLEVKFIIVGFKN